MSINAETRAWIVKQIQHPHAAVSMVRAEVPVTDVGDTFERYRPGDTVITIVVPRACTEADPPEGDLIKTQDGWARRAADGSIVESTETG